MFFHSVWFGLKTLLCWQIWVGMLGVGSISLLFMFLVGLLASSSGSERAAGAGCIFMSIGPPIIQALSISAFVLFLIPVILGGQGFTPWVVVSAIGGTVFKSGLIAMVIVLVICFLPIVGRFVANTPGLAVFLQGIFIFKPISRKLFRALTGARIPSDIYPGFLACVGYFVIGIVLTWALLIVLSIAEDKVRHRTDPVGHMMRRYSNEPTGFQFLIGQFIGPMIGIIPLLMYGKYVVIGLGALSR